MGLFNKKNKKVQKVKVDKKAKNSKIVEENSKQEVAPKKKGTIKVVF